MEQLKPGEKYLYIKTTGHEAIYAFPNKGKKAVNHPDFKGDGVAVWVREKKKVAEKLPEIETVSI